jgi:HJR/Mrr/RecB family endonuclease
MVVQCDVPDVFASRHYFDLRSDSRKALRSFVRNVSAAPNIDFGTLEWRDFERMTAELLKAIGYSISRSGVDAPFDFIARRKQTNEQWLVETKFYTRERASVAALRDLVARLLVSPESRNAMLITNSRLTSVARSFLKDKLQHSGRELRVIDGSELTELLIQNPNVVERYFRSGER